MNKTIVGYKIRRKDGRYSTGGSTPEFTSVGKVWASTSNLHNHFAVIEEYGKKAKDVYRDCELVKVTESDHVGIEYYLEAIGR